jgi:probable HAF family extracellular repeat protein
VKHRFIRVAIAAAAAFTPLVCAVSFEAAEEGEGRRYDVRALAGLGGTSSRANGITDWGLATGFSNLATGARRATLWFHGRAYPIEPLGGTHSSIAWSGANNAGLVAGITQTGALQARADGWSCRAFFPGADAARYACVGFAWEWGQLHELPRLGGQNSFAASANTKRQVVGWSEIDQVDSTCVDAGQLGFHAVIWDLNTGAADALPPFGTDTASAATAISDEGHVVGISGSCDQSVGRHSALHAVMWHDGTVTDLRNVGGDTWNTPTAITRRGDIVVGFANAPGADPDAPSFRAWLWTERNDIACHKLPGTNICDLGTLDDGAGTAEAWGVNDRGQVVGTACSPTGFCRAFLWEHGRMKDLDAMKGSYPHRLLNAMDINNLGQISGRAMITATTFEAYVATPRARR